MPTSSKPYIITIVGPESSGKTTLARQLSEDLACPWVPEFAREYLDNLERAYVESDLLEILHGQQKGVSEALLNTGPDFAPAVISDLIDQLSPASFEDYNRMAQLVFPINLFGADPRPVVIVDSGILSIRMWSAIKYGWVNATVEAALKEDPTDMYLLCRPVFPWAPDELREAPGVLDRVWIYNQFLKYLVKA